MNSLLFTLSIALPIILMAALLIACCFRMTGSRRASRLTFCNIAEGTHGSGILSKRIGGACSRYRLLKFGVDVDHVAYSGAGEVALFLATDEGATAEDLISVQALACAGGTVTLVTDGAGVLAAGDLLVAAANGKVAKKAAGAGNYYVVGVALQAAAATDGLELEAIPIGGWQTNA